MARILLQKALDSIVKVPGFATDFKENIIFLKKVEFHSADENVTFEGQVARVGHSPPNKPHVFDKYEIRFTKEEKFDLREWERKLRDAEHKQAAQAAVRLRDVLAVIMGYTLRTNQKISVIGSSRFFKQDSSQRIHVMDTPSMLAILRGFYLNVRPATNRLLVNVNVTCSIFRPRINIGRWLRMWQLEHQWDTNNERKTADLRLLHKIISKIKILYKDPSRSASTAKCSPKAESPTWSDASEFRPLPQDEETEFFIAGFARATDGCKCTCRQSPADKNKSCCKCMRRKMKTLECTAQCKQQKKMRGIVIDRDFANAQEAYFQCEQPGCNKANGVGHSVGEFLATGETWRSLLQNPHDLNTV